MTYQQFYRLAAVLIRNTAGHDKVVEDCAVRGLQSIDQRTQAEVSKLNGMSPADAVHESCRRLVKGIAAGKITYATYREWMAAGLSGAITLPEYK
jgi:hypothetical protein